MTTRTILIGAGASHEAGVPVAKEMGRTIYQNLQANEFASRNQSPIARAISIAIGGLKLHRSIVDGDPFSEIDVEDLYEVLQILANRHQNLLNPFVGSWSHAISSTEGPDLRSVSRNVAESLVRDFQSVMRGIKAGNAQFQLWHLNQFESALGGALAASRGADAKVFDSAAGAVLSMLVTLSRIEEKEKIEYLLPLFSQPSSDTIWIASLNYDNSIELAADCAGIEIDLGVEQDQSTIRFSDESRVCLAKLHGSITWSYDEDMRLRVSKVPVRSPALIFGSGNKLQIEGPYLDLLFAFRARLDFSDELYVCGYSFRDRHINHLLISWLRRGTGRRMIVADPSISLLDIERNINKGLTLQSRLRRDWLKDRIVMRAVKASEWAADAYKNQD